MNLGTMRTALETILGVPSSDGFYSSTQKNSLINEALQAVSTETVWPWLSDSTTFATVAGTATQAVPNDWMRTKNLVIDGYNPMRSISLQEIRAIPTTSRGLPTLYTVHDEVIVMRLVPDAVYTVIHDYEKVEPALSSDSDTPLMPSQFHYSIVHFAAHLAHVRAGNAQKAATSLADYNGWIRRMRDNRRRIAGPVRVRVRPGSAL